MRDQDKSQLSKAKLSWRTTFSVTCDASGWWIEYCSSRSGLKSIGPFQTRATAERNARQRGWTQV